MNTTSPKNHGAAWCDEQEKWLLSNVVKKGIEFCANKMERKVSGIVSRLLLIAYKKHTEGMNVVDVSKIVCMKEEEIVRFINMKTKQMLQKQVIVDTDVDKLTDSLQQLHIHLSSEQQFVLDLIRDGKNVLLTGQAGTGKTTVIHSICEMANEYGNVYGVTAMTGCAAVLIRGKTLHSFLGIGLANDSAESLAGFTRMRNPKVYQRLMNLQLLLVDEISMMNEELLSKISEYLSLLRKIDKPFGGIQVLFSGDFAQLPPVQGKFCFEAKEWTLMNIQTIVLTQQFRQGKDVYFQKMLSDLRLGKCTDEYLGTLKGCRETEFPEGIVPTRLYPLNREVDFINDAEFEKLVNEQGKSKCRVFKTQYKTSTVPLKTLKKFAEACGIPDELTLCIGAQIIVTWNINENIVNGTRGRIVDMNANTVFIQTVTNEIVAIQMMETYESDQTPKDKIIFMPMRLGYALSIHKSQGMTLDAVEMNLGDNIFEYGQAYVALSRAKSLANVKITEVLAKSFKIHPKVLKFYENTTMTVK